MRLIDADAMKKYCIEGLKDSEKELKIVGRYDLAKKMTEDICKDIDEQPTVDLAAHDAEIRRQTIEELLKTLCIGCAYLKGIECTNKKGCPCVLGQKYVVEKANELLEQMKGEEE